MITVAMVCIACVGLLGLVCSISTDVVSYDEAMRELHRKGW